MNINPKTGLKEETHDFYKVPLVYQKSINRIRLDGQPTAVHNVPFGNGLSLDFYSTTKPGDELIVAFHGANMKEKNFYPRFERVASLRRKGALLAFADPTIPLDKDREMLLSWFLGGPGWDPATSILKVIRKAMGKTGAKHIAFIGGSGGGYAALRMSAMIPGSLAFVQEPQTNIGNYIQHVVNTYFEKVWPGWEGDRLIAAFPERFNMVQHYADLIPNNFVYYAQSIADTSHVEQHYKPFKLAHGVRDDSGINKTGTRHFVLYDGELKGHGRITASEFDFHFDTAFKEWRNYRTKRGL